MGLIADGLLIATALTAALYCHVLSRRLRRLGNLDEGIGAQIGSLNAVVEETRGTLAETRARLETLRSNAQGASERLKRDLALAKRNTEELERASAEAERALARLAAAQSEHEALGVPDPVEAPDTAQGIEVVGGEELVFELAEGEGSDDAASEAHLRASPEVANGEGSSEPVVAPPDTPALHRLRATEGKAP